MAGRIAYYGNIVTNGLILDLDAAKRDSYPGTGTTWNDISGFQTNGTLTNGPTYSTSGAGGIVFDGVDDYIDSIGNTTSFDFMGSTGNFSIGVWFKRNANNTRAVFIGNTLTNSEKGFFMGFENGISGFGNSCMRFHYTGNAVNTRLIAGSTGDNTITTTDWIHCFFTVTTGNYVGQWYINGIPSTTTTRVGSGNANQASYYSGPSTRTLNVGRSNFSSTSIPLAGNIATIQIYNRALTAQEVLQNYNATKGRYQ
jgi:hypothetical protein